MTFLFNIIGFTEAWELFTLKHTAMKSFNTTGSGQKDELVCRTTEGHAQLVLPEVARMRGKETTALIQSRKGKGMRF